MVFNNGLAMSGDMFNSYKKNELDCRKTKKDKIIGQRWAGQLVYNNIGALLFLF